MVVCTLNETCYTAFCLGGWGNLPTRLQGAIGFNCPHTLHSICKQVCSTANRLGWCRHMYGTVALIVPGVLQVACVIAVKFHTLCNSTMSSTATSLSSPPSARALLSAHQPVNLATDSMLVGNAVSEFLDILHSTFRPDIAAACFTTCVSTTLCVAHGRCAWICGENPPCSSNILAVTTARSAGISVHVALAMHFH
jgi:hypothetical protein